MTDPERPTLLSDATMAMAYTQWLVANGFEDSAANAWRFVAETGVQRRSESSNADETAFALSAATRKSRGWIPVTIALSAVAVIAIVFVYAITTANYWTKIDQEEVARIVEVPDGTWHVSHDNKDICYVGQNYWECIDEYTSEWDFACAGRAHDEPSRMLCDEYYDVIQEMKNDAGSDEYGVVSGLVQSGRLSIRENTTIERIVDIPEQSHEAVCYLGFIGECPE